ncbi:MAG: NADH-quinone oxidoreductase subunit A [Chloroflexi bacterium]|jgi:NADH-quinone oxidoreductase subunit A|nr:NADH-quinone oxidoreductase subunit A [Chloroflexota bacterium]MBT5627998.1 NADH-quinone oxidoreductase subunit A [Chloroflexota bacterium]
MFEDYFRQYALLIIFAAAAVTVPIGMLTMSYLAQFIKVRPSRPTAVKESAYEGGMPPFSGRPARFNFRYYRYALLFVVFDVETVFLFPWAVKYGVMTRQFGLAALAAVFIFLIVVTFAYAYAWRKQDLEWVTNDDRS